MSLSDIMSNMDLTVYPIIGLVIFLAVFIAVASRALSRRRSVEYARAAALPLEPERGPTRSTPDGGRR